MALLVEFVSRETMRKWREYKARRIYGTGTLVSRLLKARQVLTPLMSRGKSNNIAGWNPAD